MKVAKLIGHGKIPKPETKQKCRHSRTGKLQQVKEKTIKSVSDEKVAWQSAKAKAKAEVAAKIVS